MRESEIDSNASESIKIEIDAVPIHSTMSAMTADEFRRMVGESTDDELLGTCFREDLTPFVFEPMPDAWREFRNEVGQQIGVAPADMRVVGSGRLGFSLKPGRNLRAFTPTSDVDLVIVSPDVFDNLWYRLLRAAYPRRPVPSQVGGWLRDRQRELYTGWLSPLEVRLDQRIFGAKAQPILEFNSTWFNALKRAGRHVPIRHEDINGRLYRTWHHADMYHLHSTASLRKTLEEAI